VAWRNTSAGQNITPNFLARNLGMPGMGPDKTASEGAFDQAYEFPNVRVAHVAVDLPVPVGYWRSVGHSHQAFFKESFIDECAHASGADPLAFRLALLADHPRERALLERVAKEAGWSPGQAAGGQRAQGIALHESFGTRVAMVVELSRVGGEVRIERVVAAVDCGLAVNPNLIAQQVDSSVVYGLSAALRGRIDFDDGRVAQGNFHDYPALPFTACPRIETHVMASTEPPGGIGEPALPPVAPALANALFVLTGRRVRTLPFMLNEETQA
jgi:isoquinoline 1-oxidoreductase beta subunit